MKKKIKKIDSNVLKEVDAYVSVLKKTDLDLRQVILFGSFAKGTNHEYSDIDLAVVATNYKRDFFEEMNRLSKLASGISSRIEAFPITPKEMKSKYMTLPGEIKKYGKVVYSAI